MEQRLRELLKELHGELEQDQSVGEEPRDLLQTVMGDIRDRLDRGSDEASDEVSDWPTAFGDRLRESLEHFGESHPTVTKTVGRVIDALSNMGI